MHDRCVHARTATGGEVVRYDRAGKWFLEDPLARRTPLTLADAIQLATGPGAQVYLGLSGGTRFDAAVRFKLRQR